MDSMLDVIEYDGNNQRYLDRDGGGGRISMQSSPRIAEARSQVVDAFLKNFPTAEWLWWSDSDAVFGANVLEQLMDEAHPTERPIVGALAFAGYSLRNLYPTVYRLGANPDELEIDTVHDYPRDTLVKVAGTGCHCVVVHRQVFIAMAAAFAAMPNGAPNPYPWYAEGHVDGKGMPIGEDLIFCIRAASLGIPTHVHTGIKTGHLKSAVLDEETWDLRQQLFPTPKEGTTT